MSDTILQTTGLTKEFKGFTAVSDVNLAVRRGSIHALIGPNGAGKTTCFNLLTKFLVPTAGSIVFNGQDITQEQPAQICPPGGDSLVSNFCGFSQLHFAGKRAPGPAAQAGHQLPLLAQQQKPAPAR